MIFVISLAAVSCSDDIDNVSNSASKKESESEVALKRSVKSIEPFFKPMGKSEKSDWLAANKEPGQTFDEYVASAPTLPTDLRRVIYVQPLGRFDANQKKVIKTATDYIEAFFGLQVKSLLTKTIAAKLSANDERFIDYPKHRQIRSGYILENILQPKLPPDAAALIAFTNEDLFPGTSMFFVFGQASLENRVAVWSLFRLDDGANYDTFLKRAMKVAVHETGHMFSMRHCTKWECVMSGTNHLAETDRRPIDACPECMAKICWMTKTDPAERYKRLERFTRQNALPKDADEFRKKAAAVR